MARFYFDICIPSQTFIDSDGLDFDDFHDAVMEAHTAADNLRRHAEENGVDVSSHSFLVRNGTADRIASVSFSGTVH